MRTLNCASKIRCGASLGSERNENTSEMGFCYREKARYFIVEVLSNRSNILIGYISQSPPLRAGPAGQRVGSN